MNILMCFGFLFLCSVVISGAVGYNYRNSEEINHTELVEKYISHHKGIPTTKVAHTEFKKLVSQSLGVIHTGDGIPYSSVILRSGF